MHLTASVADTESPRVVATTSVHQQEILDLSEGMRLLLEGVPKAWRPLMDSKGRVAYDTRRTLVSMLFHERAGRSVMEFFWGTGWRMFMFTNIQGVAYLFLSLGICNVVPRQVLLVASCVLAFLVSVTFVAGVDTKIIYYITFRRAKTISSCVLAIMNGAAFACIVDFDERGLGYIISFVVGFFMLCAFDGIHTTVRGFLTPMIVFIPGSVIILVVVVVNIGLLNPNAKAVLFTTIPLLDFGIGRFNIELSALSTFNDSSIVLIFLLISQLSFVWPKPSGVAIHGASIHLLGVPGYSYSDFEYIRSAALRLDETRKCKRVVGE